MTLVVDFDSQKSLLSQLCQQLSDLPQNSVSMDDVALAKARGNLLAEANVYRWFMPPEYGGYGWSVADQMRGYLKLSAACLSTAFVLTQRTGAVKRILNSENVELKQSVLPKLATGEIFCTVGISHLTTSHRHLGKPVLQAKPVAKGYRLNGFSPWVTGVSIADSVVVGATLESDAAESRMDSSTPGEGAEEILVYLPTDQPGVARPEIPELVALTDSCTGSVQLNDVFVEDQFLVAGPKRAIMSQGTGGNTGGLQTSALALGLASAAVQYIESQTSIRDGFDDPAEHLRAQLDAAIADLLALADGMPSCSNEQIRSQANSLVLRSTQAALMVAKGAGFRQGHPVGRWCQEALFFLVWSCPQPVTEFNLCELAQIS